MSRAAWLSTWPFRLPERHEVVRSDKALFEYVRDLKARHLRNAGAAATRGLRRQRVLQHALGPHGAPRCRARASRCAAIRVATLFKEAPAALLRMIVGPRAGPPAGVGPQQGFYQLCQHMEPEYAQLEFDLRLYLMHLDEQRSKVTCGPTDVPSGRGAP